MRNKAIHLLAIVLLSLFGYSTYGQSAGNLPVTTCKDTLGDIKYSILEPESFYALHGVGKWVLLDGRPIEGSKLYLMGVHKIPDARGMFIRSMDMGRNAIDGMGDPDWKNRNVVAPQMDTFKRHNHGMRHWWGNGGNNGQELSTNPGLTAPAEDAQEGGNETRPRNIALYIYIKIN